MSLRPTHFTWSILARRTSCIGSTGRSNCLESVHTMHVAKLILLLTCLACLPGAGMAQTAHTDPDTSTTSQTSQTNDTMAVRAQRAAEIRLACINGRRCICGKVIKIVPEGLIVE